MILAVDPSGWLTFGGKRVRCALGRSGVSKAKREGDGTTPVGDFPLRRAYYRPDRVAEPDTGLPCRPLKIDDGWCDEPTDPCYNRLVRLPHGGSAETLWRDDALYDIIVVIGFNDDPIERGRGSAIFLHLAKPDYAPTEGCVAVAPGDIGPILAKLGPESLIRIAAAGMDPRS